MRRSIFAVVMFSALAGCGHAPARVVDNPLLGHWRTCLLDEDGKMALELDFRDDGTLLHSETVYAERGCVGAAGPARTRPATYTYLREGDGSVVSFEFTSDQRDLHDDEETWLSGVFTLLAPDRMSFRFNDLIMMHDGEPRLVDRTTTENKQEDVFVRVPASRGLSRR